MNKIKPGTGANSPAPVHQINSRKMLSKYYHNMPTASSRALLTACLPSRKIPPAAGARHHRFRFTLPPSFRRDIRLPMSSQPQSKQRALDENPLGKWLRALRHARGLPLRAVAAEAEMDTALMSKIELGQRLPTEKQIAAFADFFGVQPEEMEAKRLAEKFWIENRNNPAASKAATLIKMKARQHNEKNGNHG